MKNSNPILYLVILGLIGVIVFIKFFSPRKIEKVPVKVEVKVPEISKKYDTVYLDTTKAKIVRLNNPINKKLKKQNDSLIKAYDSLSKENQRLAYLNAIKIRDYSETYEDEYQKATVNSRVRGELLAQQFSYKIKERTFTVDTVVDIKKKIKFDMYAGIQAGLPLTPSELININNTDVNTLIQKDKALKFNVDFIINKSNIKFSYDTNNYFWLGGGVQIF